MDFKKSEKKENQQNNQKTEVESSPEDKNKNIMKNQDESKLLGKSEEHIYSYANEKKKTTPDTPLKKPFKIISIVTGVIGVYLLGFALFLIIRGGYVAPMMNDLNANCRNAMVILSVFVIFTAATGYGGAYTNWKPLVLTFTVFSAMCLVGHFYVAKKELDAVRFSKRDMALSWWDVYTDDIRKGLEEKYNCCGYRYYNDLPVASANCLKSDIDTITAISSSLKTEPADTLKFDSYQKHFGDPDDAGTGLIEKTNTGATTQPVAQDPVAQDPVAQDPVAQDPVAQDPTAAAAPAAAPAAGGNIFKKRQDATAETGTADAQLAIMSATPCEGFIVNEINSKLKLVYIINFALCIVYVAAIALSLKYWTNMRKEKEFDEFA